MITVVKMSDATLTDTGCQEDASKENDVGTLPLANEAVMTRYRHDWYQTEAYVCINILIKRMKREDVHVSYHEREVSVSIGVDDGGDAYNLELALAHSINTSKCVTKVLGSKIELKMMKCESCHWESLEAKENAPKLKLPKDILSSGSTPTRTAEGKEEVIHKYPSSSHYTRDWDKLVADVKKEEKDEKPEGDAALNKLFQQIYSDGSDETRKAMNKSFMESGGTVLSTNWTDIKKEKVGCKPPDGMEWKKYEK